MSSLLTPNDVKAKTFRTHRFREAYDADEVDDFLDQIVHTMQVTDTANKRLIARNQQLEKKFEKGLMQTEVGGHDA